MRAAGGQVAWVITTFDEDIYENWSVLTDLFSPERCQTMIENICAGGAGHALWPQLVVEDQDWTIEKNRFSAFIQGSSNLEERLRAADIDTVIITGTLTDVCCESSARDAMMLNFKTNISDGESWNQLTNGQTKPVHVRQQPEGAINPSGRINQVFSNVLSIK